MKKNETRAQKAQNLNRQWFLVDAKDCVLGRLASRVAVILRGKDKPYFTPHVDCGDYVVVVNAEKVKVTGKKAGQKIYFSHSGYPGGEKLLLYKKVVKEKPARILKEAIRGMLPKGRLGSKMFKKLKIVIGNKHRFAAQKPQALDLK